MTWRDERVRVYLVGALVVLGFFLLLFWRLVFVVILPGQGGVVYDLFRGTRLGSYQSEGLTVKFPWNRIYIYDLRLQRTPVKVHALSREGMVVEMDVTVLYRPIAADLPHLHKAIGPEYPERTVVPLTLGAVREYVAQHDSQELYTVDSQVLQQEILAATQGALARHFVSIGDIVLERLTLPTTVVEAIEQKLAQEQIAAAYNFRLEAERAEAQRLQIKGAGLNTYYSLVNSALSPSLLAWRGIEATVELSQSPNSKIVIIGSGKDQLPIILGGELGKLPEPPAGVPRPSPGTTPSAPAVPRVFGPAGTPPASITPGPSTPPSGSPAR
jgi:regulator of protease activity HflC (stomatin/prohibitin superfamily)